MFPTTRRFRITVALTAALSAGPGLGMAATVDFIRDVQPLIAAKCYDCHGTKKQESGLRLDSNAAALKGGDHGPAYIVGKPAESLLIQVVTGKHPELAQMPKKGEKLTAAEVTLLSNWIAQGAVWPDTRNSKLGIQDSEKLHWAFQPVTRQKGPAVKNARQVRNEVDRFVLQRLEKEGLKLSDEAEKTALIRRLSLDLIGLPPSPEEIDAFVTDRSRDAYGKVVDRLLASPHYGEKWGRWWLDAARYADSNGFEKDRTRSIWPYRDWVIRALNTDKPFDQFTIEQLAGDILADAYPASDKSNLELRKATGFLRNSMVNMEGGVEPEKFRVETLIDRVDAVGRTWLGLTIACAQCHNHKYDPISQKEYYEFYALLNQDDEPRLEVPNAEQMAKRAEIYSKVRAHEDALLADPSVKAKFDAWIHLQRAAGLKPAVPSSSSTAADPSQISRLQAGSTLPNWQPLDAKEWHSTPMKYEKQEDLSLLAGGDIYNTGVLRVWVDVQTTNITGFRLEALNNANLPFNGPGIEGNGDFMVTEFSVEATPLRDIRADVPGQTNAPATTNQIVFRRATADWEAPGSPASKMIDGTSTNGGWASASGPGRRNEERRAVFETEKPFGFEGGTRLQITLTCKPPGGLNVSGGKVSNYLIGRARFSLTTDSGPLAVDPLTERQRVDTRRGADFAPPDVFRTFLFQEPSLAAEAAKWESLMNDWPKVETTTLALSSRPVPRTTKMFRRGDWQRLGDVVSADTPKVLPPFPDKAPRNRLGLAKWIVDAKNPLTARVVVNRVWQQYFGQGLVTTPEDFGVRSEAPSHPELLDWLAGEFVRRGWSLKELHRLIVTSATYRQSSRMTPALLEKDAYNRLLARSPRIRVDAEGVQDIALRVSGLLSEKIGGPSVFPLLPEGVMSLSYGPIAWNLSEGDDRYRRAMYTFWKRSVPYPALVTFDAPNGDQSCVRRMRSNTPLQALVTLNEPTFNHAARWLGYRALAEGGKTDEARLNYAFRLCTARKPDATELKSLQRLLDDAKKEFAASPKNASQVAFSDAKNPVPFPSGSTTTDLAAWSAVGRALLNLDETITKE